jgi:hypothetical protein
MADVLVQTRVPPAVGRWLAKQATNDGLSAAAWVRRLLLKEMSAMRTEGWVVPASQKHPPTSTPSWILERCRDVSATEVEFAVLHGPGHQKPGSPVTDAFLGDVDWYKQPAAYRFRLKGSAVPWAIVRTVYNATTARMEILLRSE